MLPWLSHEQKIEALKILFASVRSDLDGEEASLNALSKQAHGQDNVCFGDVLFARFPFSCTSNCDSHSWLIKLQKWGFWPSANVIASWQEKGYVHESAIV